MQQTSTGLYSGTNASMLNKTSYYCSRWHRPSKTVGSTSYSNIRSTLQQYTNKTTECGLTQARGLNNNSDEAAVRHSVFHFTRSRAVYIFKKTLSWICSEKRGSTWVHMLEYQLKEIECLSGRRRLWKTVNIAHATHMPDWSSTSSKYENSSIVVQKLSLTLKIKRLVVSFRADNNKNITTTTTTKRLSPDRQPP